MTPGPRPAAAPPPVRVLLCDDSATVRTAVAGMLAGEADIQVVGTAANGRQALAEIGALPPAGRPEVVLLDLEMPVMDGMTVLPLLLGLAPPRPAVIVASALTQRGAAAAMAALRAGAVDYIPKPTAAAGGLRDPGFRTELLAKLRGWARMGRGFARPPAAEPAQPVLARPGGMGGAPRVVAIGCSTGGPQALTLLVRRLARFGSLPVPVLVVQHMPPGFTAMLADHLGRLGGPVCAEVRDGEALLPGRLYIAPGDRHLLAEEAAGGTLVARLSDGPAENFCRPAVDPLLRSLVACCGGRVLAVILTGMGQDGLAGCRAITGAGGQVLAQDEASSVVWGMPGAVAKAGLAAALLPPTAIADLIGEALLGAARARAAGARA
ncbi:MAG: chemotaxis-specific protein-glutamate methyltransferase CheB [Acetobacteraceae bacterium]|nr:chemotaxis-specific protein-glutamate methyltransferase CheB [Acetobacteraceae bacterium]